jgi:branched-chain amino acid transport system substrate-binding protein
MAAAAGSAQPDFVSLGGAATEGTYFLSYYDPASPLPANQEYVKTYSATYPGKRPTEQAAYWYEVPFIIKAAIEKQGGTKDTLTPAIHKVEFDGPTGHSKFADNGDVVGKTGVVSRVTKGQIVIDSKLTADFATR